MPLTLYLLVGSFTVLLAQVWDPFDCRRLNSDCADDIGVCRSTTGDCDCTGASPQRLGYEGFDCYLRTDTILPASNCTPPCQNGGTCFNDNGQPACYCTEEYTNERCEQRRVAVTCGSNEMKLYVKPHRASIFAGTLAIVRFLRFNREELLTDPECTRSGVNDKQPDNSYDITFALNSSSPCFDAVEQTNLTNGGIRYTVRLRVLYLRDIITFVDETHVFVCDLTPTGPTGGVVVGDARPDLRGATVTGSFQVGQLEILTRNGSTPGAVLPAGDLVHIGQTLFARVFLKPNTRYTKMAVDSCAASPTGQLDDPRNRVFLENRCPKGDALYLIDSSVGTIRVDNETVLVAFYVLKFNSVTDLFVTCNLTVCQSINDPACDPVTCVDRGGPTNGEGRRKRDVGDIAHETVSQRVIVMDSPEQIEAILRGETRYRYVYRTIEEPCSENPLFIVVVAICGVLLVTILVVLVVFCRRKACTSKKLQED